MRFNRWGLGIAAALSAGILQAQTFTNSSLNTKFYFAHLLVTASGGQATNAQNLSGAITFDGKGGYTYTGKLGAGSGALAAASGAGTYAVSAAGNVILTNPINNALQIAAHLSGDGNVLVGATTEAPNNTFDVFAAIKAPATANLTNAVLNGAYTGASLQFPNGTSAAMKSAILSLAPGGNGQFSSVTVVGHSADQGNTNVSQNAAGATYNVNGDGSGSANFGSGASLFSGTREFFVSQDGSYLLGYSTASGIRDIFIATKNFSSTATPDVFNGRYWIGEMILDSPGAGACSSFSFSDASGAFQASGKGTVLFGERLHSDMGQIDFSGINSYSVNSDSTGSLSPLSTSVNNMALGGSVTIAGKPQPNAMVEAQIGAVNQTTCQYGISFAVLAPSFSGTGVFLNPAGVVNGASFAPMPSPLSPGAISSAFGSGLASSKITATTIPLPTALGGVSLNVNGAPAPLFYVSPTQINFQTPFGLSGDTVTVQVINNGSPSNQVTAPLAATGPGIFQYADPVSANRGIILHSDFSLVTPSNPAHLGETVVIYLTGLGALNPPAATGAANPGSPLATATDRNIQVLFGGEVATNVPFIGGAPTFVGLNQINAQIPTTVITGPSVPVAIATSNAFVDIVDIPIGI